MINFDDYFKGIMQVATDDPNITEKEKETIKKALEKAKPFIQTIS